MPRTEKELEGVTLLGNQNTKYAYDYDPTILEKFKKHFEDCVEDEQIVNLDCFEFVSRCIVGDTLIDVARDESLYPHGIPIKDLVGTEGYVFSIDPETLQPVVKKYKDVRCTGKQVPVVRVNMKYKSNGEVKYSSIVCTPDHLFLVKRGFRGSQWVPAEALEPNMRLIANHLNHSIVSVEPAGSADVYNMEVDDTHCFFANDVAIHNCPKTGQPDLATIHIAYIPNEYMVESKSLKLYLFSFQQHGDFHETCVHMIMQDLVDLLNPKYLEVYGDFNSRGGVSILPWSCYADAAHMELKKSRMLAVMDHNLSHRPRTGS